MFVLTHLLLAGAPLLAGDACPPPPELVQRIGSQPWTRPAPELAPFQTYPDQGPTEEQPPLTLFACRVFVVPREFANYFGSRDGARRSCEAARHLCAAALDTEKGELEAAQRELWASVHSPTDASSQRGECDRNDVWTIADLAQRELRGAAAGAPATMSRERAATAFERLDAALIWLMELPDPTWRQHARCRRIVEARKWRGFLGEKRAASLDAEIVRWSTELPRCHDDLADRPGRPIDPGGEHGRFGPLPRPPIRR